MDLQTREIRDEMMPEPTRRDATRDDRKKWWQQQLVQQREFGSMPQQKRGKLASLRRQIRRQQH